MTETWHRVAWREGGDMNPIPRVVDHATEQQAAKHEAELRAAGWQPLVYAVQIEVYEEAL